MAYGVPPSQSGMQDSCLDLDRCVCGAWSCRTTHDDIVPRIDEPECLIRAHGKANPLQALLLHAVVQIVLRRHTPQGPAGRTFSRRHGSCQQRGLWGLPLTSFTQGSEPERQTGKSGLRFNLFQLAFVG